MSRAMIPLEFHTGFDVTEKTTSKGEKLYETTCPSCGKENHFHVFETGQYNCKVCGESGNTYNLINLIYNKAIVDYRDMTKQRGLPQRALHGIKFNRFNNSFILPTYKNGKMNNLYKTGMNWRWMGTPGLGSTLFDWEEESNEDIWLCEGQWDKMAAVAIIGAARPISAIGLPGAGAMKDGWCHAFAGKNVTLIFDNDEAGVKGAEKTINVFKESAAKPRSISIVEWPETLSDGYDLRDFYQEHGKGSFERLKPLIKPVDVPAAIRLSSAPILEDTSCDTFEKALESFEKAFHTTSDMRAALISVMASIYSNKLKGDQQLWFKLIGPPGCGKTSIAKAVSASDQVVSKSTFTGLFSGWIDHNEEDPGLIPQISGKTLIVKDADALIRQPNIEKIMSELRDFYDKDTSIQYRTRRSYEYKDVRATIIIMGTQALRRADQAYLGERFLTIEMDVTDRDQEIISQKVIEQEMQVAMGISKDPRPQIMASMKGWINHLLDRKLDTTIPLEFQKDIIDLCQLTANMRTTVDRDFKRRLLSPAVPESPNRLIGQMVNATLAYSAVFGLNVPDTSVYNMIVKVLRDTINPRSNRYIICDALVENPQSTANELIEITKIPRTTLQEELEDLRELGFLDISHRPSTTAGRKSHTISLVDRLAKPMRNLL